MIEKRTEIKIKIELQREIAKKFKVSERTVQCAMRFETKSPLSRLLRSYALNHGGEQYDITITSIKVENPYSESLTI